MTFTEYLEQKKFRPSTIRGYSSYIKWFTDWLEKEQLTETFTYTDLLEFIRHLETKGSSKRTMHYLLCIIRHYCNWLIAAQRRNDNPAAGVFIKGLVRKLPANLISFEILEELYKQYQLQINVHRERKIILGLLIYQGLTVDEIIRLEGAHIKLKEGKIFIKSTKTTNERLLSLHAGQVLLLQQYMNDNKFKEGSLLKLQKKTATGKRTIIAQVKYMFVQLRQLNLKLINAQQIRSSVITHWLKANNLRQVQYMAGHKYVSSTERYQVNNLDDLKNELQQHHPMK